MKDVILVVDDEEDIRELVRYNLSKSGFNVVTAATGEEALQIAQQTKPMLVVLDIMLPGIDGLEVCRRLKGDRNLSQTPIVMVSALGEESHVVAGEERYSTGRGGAGRG
jgi:two-component system phosphate regulon response regulator PhoB